jgi:predicted HTH transcriptional regulator
MNQQAPIQSSMSLRDLKNLIRSGEGLTLEFKRAISSPEKIAREIAAFANTHGGHLVIGVDDDHTITGVESYHEQDFYLEQAAHELCTPALMYRMEIIPYFSREILLVYIEESDQNLLLSRMVQATLFMSVWRTRVSVPVMKWRA